jgi:glycosidase
VAKEEKNIGSLLNCYKRLLKVRKENIAIREGNLELIELSKLKKRCLAYRRVHEAGDVYVYLNFIKDMLFLKTPKKEPELLFSTLPNRVALDPAAYDNNIMLTAYEGIIFK